MASPDIRTLGGIRPGDLAQFGGKAVNLAHLIRAGLPVPPGVGVSSAVFRRAVDRSRRTPAVEAALGALEMPGAIPEGVVEALQAALRGCPPEGIPVSELTAAVRALSPSRSAFSVAVRSSAGSEDHSSASFAGQYESVLNVCDPEALWDAVREVWASFFSQRACAYRWERGQKLLDLDLGLVVQVMIPATVSAVLFTTNPLTGSHREMLLEAGPGLGEAYVSGQLCPDSFYLRRPGWFSTRPPRLERSLLAPKHQMLTIDPMSNRLILVDMPPEQVHPPSLTEGEISRIGSLGLRIERLFGCPQDIELALDACRSPVVLQARPIKRPSAPDARRSSGILWTRRFSGERWTDPASVLGWSIMQPILAEFIHFPEVSRKYLQDSPPTRVVNGYPYFNISIFRHLLWKLPGYAPPQFILEFFPEEEQKEILSAEYIVPDMLLVVDIFREVWRERRWRRYHWNFFTNPAAWDSFLPGLLEAVASLPETYPSPEAAREAVEVGQEWIRAYIRIHLLSLLFANLYYQLLSGLLKKWVGEEGPRFLADLVSEPEGNRTVETNQALWGVARAAIQCPGLLERLRQEEPIRDLSELEAIPDAAPFLKQLQDFLVHYGHRSSASWEIFSPRWSDETLLVLDLIRSYLRADESMDPEDSMKHRLEARKQALNQVMSHFGAFQVVRKGVLSHVIVNSRRYMTLRENQRFYFDLLLLKIRRALGSLAAHWVGAGILTEPGEITLLTLEELDEVQNGSLRGEALRSLLDTRRDLRRKGVSASHPVFLEGDSHLISPPHRSARTLSGLGISPGRITGTVRIIHQLREMNKLRRGEILVTRATDPGWTPLFLTAGGLVTELGSLLSHGAVVAREYGLPAVVNISNATQVLRDGQEITLDGSRGVIYLH